jgi:hypothetical protein
MVTSESSTRALGRLLLRGGISVGICVVTAVCVAGLLSLIAASLHPKEKAAAGSVVKGCMPSHCHARAGRQVLTAKLQ